MPIIRDRPFIRPLEAKAIEYKKLNVESFEVNQLQQNVQNSFDQLTQHLQNQSNNACFYAQNYQRSQTNDSFILFNNQIFDPYGCYDSSTGIFKSPVTGTIQLNLVMFVTVPTSNSHTITLFKNGVETMRIWFGENAAFGYVAPNTTVYLRVQTSDQYKIFWNTSYATPVTWGNNALIENQLSFVW